MEQKTRIYIIGAGAIGKALAVFLKLEAKDVILIRGSVDDLPNSLETIKVELSETTLEANVEIGTFSNYSEFNGIIILANKTYGNTQLAEQLQGRIGSSPIILIQNGLNIEKAFMDTNMKQIYRCVPFASSQHLYEPNRISFKPATVSPIGIINGDRETLEFIVEALKNRYFQFTVENSIQPVIWMKTIINCVFNTLCPLIGIDNGIFYRNKDVENIARRLIEECLIIARASNVELKFDDVLKRLLMISKSSDGQLISTYQDILNHRQTEILSLNFAIVDIAEGLNLEDKVSNIRLLGELIQQRSELSYIM